MQLKENGEDERVQNLINASSALLTIVSATILRKTVRDKSIVTPM